MISPDAEADWAERHVEPTAEFAQLQLGFVDRTQWRYEVIRPLVLFADRTTSQRAQETETHPDTVRALRRRFRQQGMLGLLPANVDITIRKRAGGIPEAVRQEIDRLKTLYDGFHYRELARILSCTFGTPFDDRMAKKLWQHSTASYQGHLGLWDYHVGFPLASEPCAASEPYPPAFLSRSALSKLGVPS